MPLVLAHDERRKRYFQFMRKLVTAGLKHGDLNPALSVHALTSGIYGALYFHLMASALSPGKKLSRKTATEIVTLYLNGARKQ
jgi:hypothetical protein